MDPPGLEPPILELRLPKKSWVDLDQIFMVGTLMDGDYYGMVGLGLGPLVIEKIANVFYLW